MPAALPTRPVDISESANSYPDMAMGSYGQGLLDAQELNFSYGIPVNQSLAYMQKH
jgi:hypothetical protein